MRVGFRRSGPLAFFIFVLLTAVASAGTLAVFQAEEQQAEEEPSEEQKELNSDLIAAATSGDQAGVRDLIARGGDVNATAGIGASTALMRSVFQGNLDVVGILIEAGAEVTAKRMDGANALKIALSPSDDGFIVEIIKALIDAGADVNAVEGDGNTLLMRAAGIGRVAVVQAMIDAGADVNAKPEKGLTATINATAFPDVVGLLIDAGADVNTASGTGYTALMRAAWAGGGDTVQLLIDAGADVNAKSDKGRTVLMHAASPRADTNVVQLLIDAGADVNATDDAGTTALDLAVADERADIAVILRAAGAGQPGIR